MPRPGKEYFIPQLCRVFLGRTFHKCILTTTSCWCKKQSGFVFLVSTSWGSCSFRRINNVFLVRIPFPPPPTSPGLESGMDRVFILPVFRVGALCQVSKSPDVALLTTATRGRSDGLTAICTRASYTGSPTQPHWNKRGCKDRFSSYLPGIKQENLSREWSHRLLRNTGCYH